MNVLKCTQVLNEIAKHSHNPIIITDLDQQILYANKGFHDMCGYTFDEVNGKRPSDLLQGPETDVSVSKEIARKLSTFQHVNERLLNYHKDGHPYWVNLNIFPLFDESNKPSHFMAIETLVQTEKADELDREKHGNTHRNYLGFASKLQDTLLRNSESLEQLFGESFVLDLPKNKVGGDFYLTERVNQQKVLFLGDCTGHGLSGAIMTAICSYVVKDMLKAYRTVSPSIILNKARNHINQLLISDSYLYDGMEGVIVFVDEERKELRYASDKQKLFLLNPRKSSVLRSKRQASKNFIKGDVMYNTIVYQPGDILVLASDGYANQLGYDEGKLKRIGSQRLFKLLSDEIGKTDAQLKSRLMEHFFAWQGSEEEQTDDMLMVGVKLN